MIIKLRKNNNIGDKNLFVDPDEIFLDSQNLENFDRQQFEGRIEKPISKRTVIFLGVFFLFGLSAFVSRLGYLQIIQGKAYAEKSADNTLEKQLIFADRGIIYDRNGLELAWNQEEDGNTVRQYSSPGLSHLLGYVSYPARDENGRYWQKTFVGKAGLEKVYNDLLSGQNGAKLVETDARGKTRSENVINLPVNGKDLITTIDSKIQKELYRLFSESAKGNSFAGAAGIIMDVKNGELIASTSFPEYDSKILSLGKDKNEIGKYLTDKRNFFMDRTMAGLYSPGSIVKPFFAIGVLKEGIIDPLKKILSTGSISIPNPYFPDKPTVFKDWRPQGWVDMREALAVSSDVYFYEVGGGYKDQPGLGIDRLDKYARLFGIGQATGVDLPNENTGIIPSPAWKEKNFPGDPWRVGDTYHTAIGQYGFQVTPIEMARAVSAIANYGILPQPHFLLGDKSMEAKARTIGEEINKSYYDIVREGMRDSVLFGTSAELNVPYVEIASKTGTAQVGADNSKVNSWVVGFFPYNNPKYAFTLLVEGGPSSGWVSAVSIARNLFDWMNLNTPGYFKN